VCLLQSQRDKCSETPQRATLNLSYGELNEHYGNLKNFLNSYTGGEILDVRVPLSELMTIDPELAEFLQSGLATHLATRDETLAPWGARVTAIQVEPNREHVVAFVPQVSAAHIVADLENNGQAAVGFVRPADERACQLKGVFVESRPAAPGEHAFVMAQWERCLEGLEVVGYPRVATDGWTMWPCVAVRIRVTALFSQTPGPGAGAPIR